MSKFLFNHYLFCVLFHSYILNIFCVFSLFVFTYFTSFSLFLFTYFVSFSLFLFIRFKRANLCQQNFKTTTQMQEMAGGMTNWTGNMSSCSGNCAFISFQLDFAPHACPSHLHWNFQTHKTWNYWPCMYNIYCFNKHDGYMNDLCKYFDIVFSHLEQVWKIRTFSGTCFLQYAPR